jgi:recombination protein RecA
MSDLRGSVRDVREDRGLTKRAPWARAIATGQEELARAVAGWARGKKGASDMDRDKMLDVALTQIEKQYGKGAVMRLGEHPMGAGISVIPSGSIALDIALGVGGIPRGRIVEVFGPEGSGKTTVCLHMIAEAQRRGGIAAFVDAEHALDPTYAQRLGVNIDELLVSQPDSGEQALEIADMLVRSGALEIVVVDSVAALVPRAEIEGEMGDSHVGLQARLMSQAMRKLAGSLSRFETTAVFINQLREKIGVMFGNPETTPGGRALKFYSSVRLDVRKIENLKDGTDIVGSRTRVKVVKNKVAPPFRQCEFDIMYGLGVSKEGSLLDVGVDMEMVKKSGAWFTYEGEQLGQGRENARQFLIEHTDVAVEIERKVRAAVGLDAFGEDADKPVQLPDAVVEESAAPKKGSGSTKAREAEPVTAG